MLEIPIGGLIGLVGRSLDLIKQKIYVYIEVSFGAPKPYALTVINRSSFFVEVQSLDVEPDGFPDEGNGWHLSGAGLFKGQRLAPGQRIRFLFEAPQLGDNTLRQFSARYCSYLFGRRIPRSIQTTVYRFDARSHTVPVMASLPINP